MPPKKVDTPDIDSELRETLDLLGEVLTNVSDRVDAQGELLVELAKARADAELMAIAAEKAVKTSLEPLMHQLVSTLENLTGDQAKLRQRLRDIRQEQRAQSRWRPYLPFGVWLGCGLLVALLLALGAPRLLASSDSGCWLIGGQWVQGNDTTGACVAWRGEFHRR